MSRTGSPEHGEGRPGGGPLFFTPGNVRAPLSGVRAAAAPRRTGLAVGVAVLAALAPALLACGGGGEPGRPSPDDRSALSRPLEVYESLGLITGPPAFPVVGSFGTLAGPGDSTWVVFGLSLPSQALRFQREPTGFRAEYQVNLEFRRDTILAHSVESRETVRVPTFAQTERTDESVVFQTIAALAPGEYVVSLQARDAQGSRGFRATDTLVVPAYGPGATTVSQPLLVYRVSGRVASADPPDLILNPRHSAEYGGQPPRMYVEVYGAPEGTPLRIVLQDAAGQEVWSDTRSLDLGEDSLRYLILDIPAGALDLGRVTLTAEPQAPGLVATTTPLLVTLSDQWVVANFEEVLQFVGYIASEAELDSLRSAEGPERQAAWDRFWQRRDPLPATPINEFRESFFERVRIATQQFREAGTPGWRTDRGEVYIVLGAPSSTAELTRDQMDMGPERGRAIQWLYDSAPGGRLSLIFVDQTGFGRFELTPSSRSAFRAAAERLRPRT